MPLDYAFVLNRWIEFEAYCVVGEVPRNPFALLEFLANLLECDPAERKRDWLPFQVSTPLGQDY